VQGTGLGLTICKAIATRYQGNIVAKSDAGKGAAFTITFPYAGTSEVLP
jgi:signal transduction histidine kinase